MTALPPLLITLLAVILLGAGVFDTGNVLALSSGAWAGFGIFQVWRARRERKMREWNRRIERGELP